MIRSKAGVSADPSRTPRAQSKCCSASGGRSSAWAVASSQRSLSSSAA
ncbi:hypothetical protein MU852_11100 [Brevundimonas albigilva]|nr:hypothetical protein [Brevundimonas albigilva]UQV17442.1 hypothetical protein MU852_11100 [Brevundimonas albigilva]